MDGVKEKLDKWGSGWRLIAGVITPVIMITAWSFTQVYTLKIDIIKAVNGLEKTFTKEITNVRKEASQLNNVYHSRVDLLEHRMEVVEDKIKVHQDPTNGLHDYGR